MYNLGHDIGISGGNFSHKICKGRRKKTKNIPNIS